jgi:hypothetical protein
LIINDLHRRGGPQPRNSLILSGLGRGATTTPLPCYRTMSTRNFLFFCACYMSISGSSHAKQFFLCDLPTFHSRSVFEDCQKKRKAFGPCWGAINCFGHSDRLSCFVVSFCLRRRRWAAGKYVAPSCACQASFLRVFSALSRRRENESKQTTCQSFFGNQSAGYQFWRNSFLMTLFN